MSLWRKRDCDPSHGSDSVLSLPSYIVRESRRARNVRLVLSPRTGLEVVVPQGFDRDLIPEIVRRRAGWVEQVTARFEAQRRPMTPEAAWALPEGLPLRAIGEDWRVEYRRTASSRVVARPRADRVLVVSGEIDDTAAVRAAVSRWLAREARDVLVPWLEDLAYDRGFVHGPVTVRSQRTRWASCSGKKAISVNLRLLFLPEDLVSYVLMHELCHTVRMDHSRAFWTLVRKFEPDFRAKNRRLKEGWKYVPGWLESERTSAPF